MPKRDVISEPISTRPGDKLLAAQWSNKEIQIKGRIFGTSVANLQANVDTLQQNFAVQSLALSIDTGRTYTATLTDLQIPTQFFNMTMAEYTANFLCIDPFSYGSQLTASGTVVSGTQTYSGTLTISGTVFAEPLLVLNPTGAPAGDSGMRVIQIYDATTGETMTISGSLINYTSPLSVDYKNFYFTNSGVQSDYTGIFSRFDVGTVNYTITVTSGVKQGYNYTWSYTPRYYQ